MEQDEDGYPPYTTETLWVQSLEDGTFIMDNNPFFVREATYQDVVSGVMRDGVLCFDKVVRPSSNSLIRIISFDTAKVEFARSELKRLGCDSEWAERFRLISVNIPATVDLATVQAWLKVGSVDGWMDYEEPILRQ